MPTEQRIISQKIGAPRPSSPSSTIGSRTPAEPPAADKKPKKSKKLLVVVLVVVLRRQWLVWAMPEVPAEEAPAPLQVAHAE